MKDFNPNQTKKVIPKSKPKSGIKTSTLKPLVYLVRSLLTISVIMLLIYGISFLPSYLKQPIKPQYISVSGNNLLSTETILNYLPIYKNTRWIDIDSFEFSHYLSSHPWIEKAQIQRKANMGLDINIVEVSPIAYLKSKNRLFLLSRNYRLLNLERSGKGWDLPVIVNNELEKLKPGDILPKTTLSKAFELVELLENHPILPLNAVSEIDITDPLNIQLVVMPNSVRIKLGSSNYNGKLLNLQDVMQVLEGEGANIRYIDLRYKRAVVFRRKV